MRAHIINPNPNPNPYYQTISFCVNTSISVAVAIAVLEVIFSIWEQCWSKVQHRGVVVFYWPGRPKCISRETALLTWGFAPSMSIKYTFHSKQISFGNDHNQLILAHTGHWPCKRWEEDIRGNQGCHGNASHPALAPHYASVPPSRRSIWNNVCFIGLPGGRACVRRGASNWTYLFWCVSEALKNTFYCVCLLNLHLVYRWTVRGASEAI